MKRSRWAVAILIFLAVAAVSEVRADRTKRSQAAWQKWCGDVTAVSKDNEGKEVRRPGKACVTYRRRTDALGKLSVTTGLWRVEGEEKQYFFVAVPPGIQVRHGLRVSVFPKDIWDDREKHGKTEGGTEVGGQELKLGKTSCRATDCSVLIEATPGLISDLQTNGGLTVSARASKGARIAASVSLDGFADALAGPANSALHQMPAEQIIQCAGSAPWVGCSMQPIPQWRR